MLIAWTTVADRDSAEKLATDAIDTGLAVCVQIEGPVTSVYRWQGQIEQASEYRLMFKVLPENAATLEAQVLVKHPYETPEWIVVPASRVGEKYLSWSRTTANSSPF